MNKKIIIMAILTIFLIGSVSAASYTDTCHSDGVGKLAKKHNANWTKTDAGWSYCGKVKRNGYIYKKYVKLYKYNCVCYTRHTLNS